MGLPRKRRRLKSHNLKIYICISESDDLMPACFVDINIRGRDAVAKLY